MRFQERISQMEMCWKAKLSYLTFSHFHRLEPASIDTYLFYTNKKKKSTSIATKWKNCKPRILDSIRTPCSTSFLLLNINSQERFEQTNFQNIWFLSEISRWNYTGRFIIFPSRLGYNTNWILSSCPGHEGTSFWIRFPETIPSNRTAFPAETGIQFVSWSLSRSKTGKFHQLDHLTVIIMNDEKYSFYRSTKSF